MPGVMIDGKPVRRLVGMIYWYGWGDDWDFDIRKVRQVLGLPVESPHDRWFMQELPDSRGALALQMGEILDALNGRPFQPVLDEAERLSPAEAAISTPRRTGASTTDDDCPF